MNESSVVKTRFAPSPSGELHVGGARTALFCWAYAMGHDGRFILRIEDTDRKRSSDAASAGFLDSLTWLGIDWQEGPVHGSCGGGDDGPYYASQRLEIYHAYIEQLITAGHAYRAFETEEELTAARAAARAEKRNYRYDRASLQLDQAAIDQYVAEGRPHVVRFKLPDAPEKVVFNDKVLGEIATPMTELDDFVILKKDGYPTYHFAVVVDDELMGVTHVIRGQEHVVNTPRHIVLQEAFGFRRPVYAHVSVIFNPDGSKMSKRDKDKALRSHVRVNNIDAPPSSASGEAIIASERWDWWLADKTHQLDLGEALELASSLDVALPEINVSDFRRAGYLPELLVNYLALLGWSPGGDVETFDRAFLIDRFDLDRLIKAPAKFDRAKLLSFNHDAIQALAREQFAAHLKAHCQAFHTQYIERFDDEQFAAFAAANQARSKTLDDPPVSCRFILADDDAIDWQPSKPVRKALINGEPCGFDMLEKLLPLLEGAAEWSPASIDALLEAAAESLADGNLGKVAQPLRVAVTGGGPSPGIGETLNLVGKQSVITRVKRCLAQRPQLQGVTQTR